MDLTSQIGDERYRLHADLCKVLTDPKRLMILDALRGDDRSVGELAETLGIALPNASQHLAVLRNAGLVEGRRTGTTIVYRLAEPTIVEACDIVQRIVQRRLGLTAPNASSAQRPDRPTTPAVAPLPSSPI